ncbi:hypothetical protein BB561_000651 [Smittium simulii]|uniref:HMG box domain-containing protein n=1 Tax=Smittium simulii TaxID=133385 RepID=A0A2T9YY82_9FUNG|nr:hypothetical protein BB561_000651 [Smittium simulii]
MLRQSRLTKSHLTHSLATRDWIVGQNKLIRYAAVLWQNGSRLSIFNSKNSLCNPINIKHYSSKSKDADLLGVDIIEQNVPTTESIKILKSSKYTPDPSLNEEASNGNRRKIREAKSLELQKSIFKMDQNKLISKQNEKHALEKLKSYKNSTELTQLVVPINNMNTYMIFVQAEYKRMKSDPNYEIALKDFVQNAKNISAKWKFITESEKLEYQQTYKIFKEQHTTELYKWWDNVDKNLIKMENRRRRSINKIRKANGIKRLSKLVDPRAPKMPASAYTMFQMDLKKSNRPDAPTRYIDFSKYTVVKWKKLPESEKNIYKDKYRVALHQFKEASKKYQ